MQNNSQPLGGKIKPCHITPKINPTIGTGKATQRELSSPAQVRHHNISELDFTPIDVSHLKCPEIRTNHFYFVIQLWTNPRPQPITPPLPPPRSLGMKCQRLLLIYCDFRFNGISRSLWNRKCLKELKSRCSHSSPWPGWPWCHWSSHLCSWTSVSSPIT